MKLTVTERAGKTKSETKQIRRDGKIPAILYSKERPCEQITIVESEFSAILRSIKPGTMSTTVFTLMFGGKQRRAIVKDIQYQITTYDVVHLDFEELIEGVPVNVKVPIQCIGAAESPGIKLGGFLRQVIRYVKVQCLPKSIPAEFVLNVGELGIKQTKRLSDIELPSGVELLAPPEEVVVVIAKR